MLMANGLSELIRLPDVLRLSLYLSALLPLSHSFLDELTSARCQAKCLSDFEAESLDKGVTRKQLKHTIISKCRDDDGCASCSKACRVGFSDLSNCYESVCKDTLSMANCYRSCHFMQDITLSKPGICPTDIAWPRNTENCEMSCINDGDCVESSKCCLSGCSKSCIPAEHPNDGLLPKPSEVTVVERKSGRSATIRWVMARMRPEHDKTLANLYVIQWKFASNLKNLNTTKWQTISVKNKLFAIIKHLLTPGLLYKFRVAAVNINGSSGFSAESSVFQLTKASFQLGTPENLKAEMYQMLEETVAYKVTWLQCDTDSKVIHYRLVLYENQQELEADHLNSELKREIILSPNEHHVILRNLHFAMSYHLELACKVEIEDSAVYSDETTLTFKTPPEPPVFQTSQFTTETYEYAKLKFVENHSPALVKSIQIENPNFQDGSLKAMVYWTVSLNSTDDNNTIKDSPVYISWWPKVCFASPHSDLHVPIKRFAITTESFYELDSLLFGCHYEVTLSISTLNDNNIPRASYSLSFQTPSCEQFKSVLGNVLACPTTNFDVPSVPENLHCKVLIESADKKLGKISNLSAECFWDPPQSKTPDITGYRIVSGLQKSSNDLTTLDKTTAHMRVVKPEVTSIQLNNLLADSTYLVVVEPLSISGIGHQATTTFSTSFVSFNRPKDGFSSSHFLSVNSPDDISLVLEEIEYAGSVRPVRRNCGEKAEISYWIVTILLLLASIR